MAPVISVIVPVYKVEPYLRRCLDSVCNQTFRDLEIILVDDGSPDACGQICDEYAAKDSRIRVIHKENGGISSARNAGIAAAQCDLIGFVDSDDYVEPDLYEFLYHNLIKEDADISVCGIYEHLNGQILQPVDPNLRVVASGHDAVKTFLPLDASGNATWNKLYRKHVFSEIQFPEGQLWEDSYVMVRLIDNARKVVFDMQPKCHYIRRKGSITMSVYHPGLMDMVNSQAFIYHYVVEKYPDLVYEAIITSFNSHFYLLNMMQHTKMPVEKEHKAQVIRFLRENRKIIYKSPYHRKLRKLLLWLLCIHEGLYKIAYAFVYGNEFKDIDESPNPK